MWCPARDVRPQTHVELRDLFHQQPVQPHVLAHPVVGRLRAGAQVLHGAVGLADEVHYLAALPQIRARCVLRVPNSPLSRSDRPARQCATGSATSVQPAALAGGSACVQGGACLPRSGFVVSLAKFGLAIWVRVVDEPLQVVSELARHALQRHAVRFHLPDVLWWEPQFSLDACHEAEHAVVDGAQRPVVVD